MKSQTFIYIALALITLNACQKKETQPAEKPVEAVDQKTDTNPIDTDPSVTDAITSATARPNTVSFNGVIVTAPQSEATVAVTMGGIVHQASIVPGQYVQKGTIIATLENPDFISLQQNYREALAQEEYLRQEYERQKTLADQKAASMKKYQEAKSEYLTMKSRLESAEAQLSLLGISGASLQNGPIQPLLEVKAPISGYIEDVNINRGKYVQPGEPLCQVIDKSAPMLCLTTYEKDVNQIKEGDNVQFRVNGLGNDTYKGKIISVGQMVDPVNRSIKVYVRILDASSAFRPGMYVTAQIEK